MTSSPMAPRMLRGALIGLDPMNPVASVIAFQYNPDTMTRRLEARTAGGGSGEGDRTEALRLSGPPRETITLSVEVDAADLPGGSLQALLGVYPPLSALEMLLYPKTASVVANIALAMAGTLEIIAPEQPLTLFVWGPARVLPVRVQNMSITEEAYDTLLNPTRAKVDLSMDVLSYHDLRVTNAGHALFLVHQVTKEVLASSNLLGSAANVGTSLRLF
jgi:hypothetical protein